ncbi:branched-chain amino acid ABC transporter permease [Haladaptatus sp. DYF46]|uniref:branched-chain amino acid ABC transporter permease n=1 Tax=Haladaptatus sp. DYF46 TaxID=2886041 RepID=UPI001E395F19|nr:branched-chain amino acid ABC transporter permease [Haladaptatus sp. DYF46]
MAGDQLVRIGALLIDGLSIGLLYAMLGLGITLVFGLGGILNLALGVFSITALIVTFELTGSLPIVVAAAVAIVGVAAMGLILERTLLQLVYRSEGDDRLMLGIFTTLGLSILLQGVLSIEYSGLFSVPAEISSVQVFGAFIRGGSLVTLALSLLTLLSMYLFFSRTYTGMATRTIMQDEIGAVYCGIDTRRMRTFVFVLSIAIASFAGVLYGLTFEAGVSDSFDLTITAVIVSIVGGVTSIPGVVAAGVLIGILTTFVSAFFGSYVATISLFGTAIVVLLLKPEGIQ